jgi:hypothetical protein
VYCKKGAVPPGVMQIVHTDENFRKVAVYMNSIYMCKTSQNVEILKYGTDKSPLSTRYPGDHSVNTQCPRHGELAVVHKDVKSQSSAGVSIFVTHAQSRHLSFFVRD